MSPRSKQQFEEIREASQRKIFDASLELFGTKGYEAPTRPSTSADAFDRGCARTARELNRAF